MVDLKDPFFAIAHRWVGDIYDTRPSVAPKMVYHYTDASGLIGMLSGGTVWATDYRFLNDKSEVKHTRTQVGELVRDVFSKEKESLAKQLYEKIIYFQDIESESDAFVFSMSEKRDDLSQWRGYAREGRGFTMGFCGRTLCNLSEGDDSRFAFFKVEYDHAVQVSVMARGLAEIKEELERRISAKGAAKASLISSAAAAFDWLTEARAVAHKHSSFRSEDEWRAVVHVDATEIPLISVRASGSRLVRFVNLEIGDARKLPLKEIGIGPGFTSNEEVVAVRSLCQIHGYDPKMYFADTPYRRL